MILNKAKERINHSLITTIVALYIDMYGVTESKAIEELLFCNDIVFDAMVDVAKMSKTWMRQLTEDQKALFVNYVDTQKWRALYLD